MILERNDDLFYKHKNPGQLENTIRFIIHEPGLIRYFVSPHIISKLFEHDKMFLVFNEIMGFASLSEIKVQGMLL